MFGVKICEKKTLTIIVREMMSVLVTRFFFVIHRLYSFHQRYYLAKDNPTRSTQDNLDIDTFFFW